MQTCQYKPCRLPVLQSVVCVCGTCKLGLWKRMLPRRYTGTMGRRIPVRLARAFEWDAAVRSVAREREQRSLERAQMKLWL